MWVWYALSGAVGYAVWCWWALLMDLVDTEKGDE